MGRPALAGLIGLLVAATPVSAAAEVLTASENALVTSHRAELPATPPVVWATLVEPRLWWADGYTWSGHSENLSLDPRAGGCFCETLPATARAPAGSVEHLRVIHVHPGRLLRLSGALGPLQQEGLAGTLSIALEPRANGRTEMVWTYTVSGYRAGAGRLGVLAEPVDAVLAQQVAGLSKALSGPNPSGAGVPVDSAVESH